DFAAARATKTVGAWLQGLTREDAAFHALVAARARYVAALAAGGWAPIPASASGKAAVRARLAAVQERVAAEGYTDLADFQQHHGLKADGILTAQTIQALNVPVETRLATIDANIERLRWFADPLPTDRIEADIAGAQVELL